MCVCGKIPVRAERGFRALREIAAVGQAPQICVGLLEQNVFYQMALLFHVSFKRLVLSVAKKSSSSKKSRSREVKEYVPEDHDFGLMPPPIHVGRYLREKRSEYKLPFDLWWLYKNKQLVYNDELANNYKKIRTNVYVDIKPDSKNEDHQPCMCCPPKDGRRKGCGMECLNRNKLGYLLFTLNMFATVPCESPLAVSVRLHRAPRVDTLLHLGIARVFYRISRNENRGLPQLVRIPGVLL
uniref:Histone-lysine N-methyltransferase ASH1L n=1 Tax=Araneus ventricosus TaxID=182803 RepID=A0A4Y2U1Z2_ARAVE|nr:Histone-lysine N-methyltransferase ASH1L [Araneus ventricosus]GBO06858.1 Histone-lysine N-methyltransferase ASH1L [Araneus ventricosus]GBO06863.1 Histone-lysine N-methyltransferase ASH1L [Araneus ventricosus]